MSSPVSPSETSLSESPTIEEPSDCLDEVSGEILEMESTTKIDRETLETNEIDLETFPSSLEDSDSSEGLEDRDAIENCGEPEAESFDVSETSTLEPGSLLKELEARQDEVLESLDELDRQICEVLRGCGVTLDGEEEDAVSDAPVRRAA